MSLFILYVQLTCTYTQLDSKNQREMSIKKKFNKEEQTQTMTLTYNTQKNYFISLYLQIKSFRFDYLLNNLFFFSRTYIQFHIHSAPFIGYFSFHFNASSSCLAFLSAQHTYKHTRSRYICVCVILSYLNIYGTGSSSTVVYELQYNSG